MSVDLENHPLVTLPRLRDSKDLYQSMYGVWTVAGIACLGLALDRDISLNWLPLIAAESLIAIAFLLTRSRVRQLSEKIRKMGSR